MTQPTHYEVLGISSSASQDEIKDAYRQAVRTAHPDAGGTPGMFRLVMVAYETLRDPAQRASYDAQLSGADTDLGAEQHLEADVEEPDVGWGTERVRDAEVPRNATPFVRDRILAWAARSIRAHRARSICWGVGPVCYVACVAVLVFPDVIRPVAAGSDVFSWLLQLPPLTLVLVAFYTILARPLLIGVLEAFALPHGLAFLGFAVWPLAYWDIATAGERAIYGGFFVAFLLYLTALSTICIVNEADQEVAGRPT